MVGWLELALGAHSTSSSTAYPNPVILASGAMVRVPRPALTSRYHTGPEPQDRRARPAQDKGRDSSYPHQEALELPGSL